MTRWMPFRGQGHLMVNHVVEKWRHDMGGESRYEPACGMNGKAPVELKGGEWWCAVCARLVNGREGR